MARRELENARVMIKKIEGAPLVETLQIADRKSDILVSNRELNRLPRVGGVLLEGHNYGGPVFDMSNIIPFRSVACWTGTMGAYTEPGKKLGKILRYTDPKDGQKYVFPVPEIHRDEKDAILVVEHPNYSLEKDGKDFVVRVPNSEDISLVINFPSEDGIYQQDSKHGIPQGYPVSRENASFSNLMLNRIGERVSNIVRVFDSTMTDLSLSSDVFLTPEPSITFAMAVYTEPPIEKVKNRQPLTN